MPATDAVIDPALGAPKRARQLRLFTLANPLTQRLGDTFFRSLPRQPGVYFFYDDAERLLYIGQSNNLRARVGSYRHVTWERHPRRTLRLVHRVRRIAWELCETPEAAVVRESELLLTLRPPFNRAGVWKGDPWWLCLRNRAGMLHLAIHRSASPETESHTPTPDDFVIWAGSALTKLAEEDTAPEWFGPFGASFPFVYASFVRTLWRRSKPNAELTDYPAGWLNARRVTETRLACETDDIAAFLRGHANELVPQLGTAEEGSTVEVTEPTALPAHEQVLLQDMEILQDFFARHTSSVASAQCEEEIL
jgi:hypothetical protein